LAEPSLSMGTPNDFRAPDDARPDPRARDLSGGTSSSQKCLVNLTASRVTPPYVRPNAYSWTA